MHVLWVVCNQAWWRQCGQGERGNEPVPMPPRLFLEEELGPLILAMQNKGLEKAQGKPKAGGGGGSSSPQHYGRGKRIREVSEIAGGCILWPLQLVHLSSAVD